MKSFQFARNLRKNWQKIGNLVFKAAAAAGNGVWGKGRSQEKS
jgi:hypothetical protein